MQGTYYPLTWYTVHCKIRDYMDMSVQSALCTLCYLLLCLWSQNAGYIMLKPWNKTEISNVNRVKSCKFQAVVHTKNYAYTAHIGSGVTCDVTQIHEWVVNIHDQNSIAQGHFTNVICTPAKQWGMCDYMMLYYHWSNPEGYGHMNHIKSTKKCDVTTGKQSHTKPWPYVMGYGSGHETAAVLLPGFAISW